MYKTARFVVEFCEVSETKDFGQSQIDSLQNNGCYIALETLLEQKKAQRISYAGISIEEKGNQ